MKCEAMYKLKNQFPVVKMCEALKMQPASYYRWINQEQRRKTKRIQEQLLINRVERVFLESDKTYGYRAMHKELLSEGISISEYKVRKLMKENGFYPETTTKYKPYHNGKTEGKYRTNRLKQDFKTELPGKVLAGDITYIKTKLGWVYLAVVVDLFNREIVGYSLSKKIDTELVKRALVNSLGKISKTEEIVFHSDRGCQYSSKSFQELLEEHNIQGSMSRPGCPYDNSCVESFFATLKKERIYRRDYVGEEDLRKDMFKYIVLFYNRKRRHSYLGYMSPVEYRMEYERKKSA